MRIFSVLCLVILMALSSEAARKRGERSGKIADGTYSDSEFHFSINIYDKWKGTLGNAGDTCRLKIVDKYMGEAFERTGGTDAWYLSAPSKVEVWAFDSADSVRELIYVIVSESSTNPLHKPYMKAIQCNEAGGVLQGVVDNRWQEIGPPDNRWLIWSGLYRYSMRDGEGELTLDVGVHLMGRRIRDHVLFMLLSYDPHFGDQVYQESLEMLESLTIEEE